MPKAYQQFDNSAREDDVMQIPEGTRGDSGVGDSHRWMISSAV